MQLRGVEMTEGDMLAHIVKAHTHCDMVVSRSESVTGGPQFTITLDVKEGTHMSVGPTLKVAALRMLEML